MLKSYVQAREAVLRLRTDKRGVVSFEYVIVAACIVAAVAAAFGTGATGGIGTALTDRLSLPSPPRSRLRSPARNRMGHWGNVPNAPSIPESY